MNDIVFAAKIERERDAACAEVARLKAALTEVFQWQERTNNFPATLEVVRSALEAIENDHENREHARRHDL